VTPRAIAATNSAILTFPQALFHHKVPIMTTALLVSLVAGASPLVLMALAALRAETSGE
jgi:hypothetical protein